MSGLIYKKMSLVMADIGAVKKDQKNAAQGFKFRGIDQFVNALHPALTKHGVFMAPKVTSERSELKEVTRSSGKQGFDKHVHLMVEYTFWAEDGSSVTVGPIASEGLDSGDKATNKALSGALKYALIQTFSVPTQDMVDQDTDSPEIGNAETTTKSSEFNSPMIQTPADLPRDTGFKRQIGAPKTNGVVNGASTPTITAKTTKTQDWDV